MCLSQNKFYPNKLHFTSLDLFVCFFDELQCKRCMYIRTAAHSTFSKLTISNCNLFGRQCVTSRWSDQVIENIKIECLLILLASKSSSITSNISNNNDYFQHDLPLIFSCSHRGCTYFFHLQLFTYKSGSIQWVHNTLSSFY